MKSNQAVNGVFVCALAGIVMAYGWGYRGVTGHEGGAMIPGAMLGMAVCLGSGRLDWYRRSAVAGLCGAVGWAWGGSMSYMEQTMYTVSDSLPDVFYGYAVLFLMGGLWAGIGGAVLGLAFTLPRSALHRLTEPLVALSTAYLLTYFYLFFDHETSDSFARFTAEHFHDGDWFAALTALLVCFAYAIIRPAARKESLLFAACAAGWWIGYLGFTKFGGISLAPPYRSESWGGVVGMLAVLIAYLVQSRNRAALMLCLYGVLGGGLAFSLAVFVRHPVRVEWGPFAPMGGMLQWKIAEESFGLFMGLAIALGILQFAKGGLKPPAEDSDRKWLDSFAVFVVLVALMWINLRRAPMAWIERYNAIAPDPVMGMPPWMWYVVGGVLLSMLGVYTIYLHCRNELTIAPLSAYGKGTMIMIFLLWLPAIGGFVQHLPGARQENHPIVDMTFIGASIVATAMLLAHGRNASAAQIPSNATATPDDPRWRLGLGHYALWGVSPFILLGVSFASMEMQEAPVSGHRLRFGPQAYWREASMVMGKWNVDSKVDGNGNTSPDPDLPFTAIEFKKDRSVVVTLPDGQPVADAHRWRHADSRIHLDWFGRIEGHAEAKAIVMTIEGELLKIPWPPARPDGFLLLHRSSS
ncbi:MAG: hypothetical protein AMXMBFR84_47250 [Candidatus Hydrogenedentota bacterium]